MSHWVTKNLVDKLPTLANWSDLGFVEVARPEDFYNIKYIRDWEKPEIKGVLCPVPSEFLPDGDGLSRYYNAIQSHPNYKKNMRFGNDVSNRLNFLNDGRARHEDELPQGLIVLENMLCSAFERTLDREVESTSYLINSNYHRRPTQHKPAGVLSVDGATTIMFQVSARGQLTGKKSLPPHSIAIFIGWHAAPDLNGPRLNILCV